ncbi:hypothetical protein I2I05_09915 [Hymenobacter sp. BT683]|uniref:Lipoprotein n=1 Tax=Hymenobacter jeongseonensis TaxID=2791027 RepID=A0ABS0IH68_9BACT|nr:hypothetical protein [Hymenobacter jeongseonensis]MBF9237708.1 hypothetical protein [Hymenobacter jeongseonensis]
MQKSTFILVASFSTLLLSCTSNSQKENVPTMEKSIVVTGEFGTCCKDLKDAMDPSKVHNSFFRIEKNNVLYLTVGYVNSEAGSGYFDQAVIYCPFCGQKVQERVEIKGKAGL